MALVCKKAGRERNCFDESLDDAKRADVIDSGALAELMRLCARRRAATWQGASAKNVRSVSLRWEDRRKSYGASAALPQFQRNKTL